MEETMKMVAAAIELKVGLEGVEEIAESEIDKYTSGERKPRTGSTVGDAIVKSKAIMINYKIIKLVNALTARKLDSGEIYSTIYNIIDD